MPTPNVSVCKMSKPKTSLGEPEFRISRGKARGIYFVYPHRVKYLDLSKLKLLETVSPGNELIFYSRGFN